jgi:hypothetical protein
MKNDSTNQLEFTPLKSKKVLARFDGPQVSSDAGVMLLREVEQQIGVIGRLAAAITDTRRHSHVSHLLSELLHQRTFQICLGYEDADDCDHLKNDPAFKAAAGRDPEEDPDLASQPTMTRLENAVDGRDLLRMGYALVDQFIDSYTEPPQLIVLDMDPTVDAVYGHQQLRLFNAYEDEYCFMPFHVYEGTSGKLITTVLRAGKTPTASEIMSVLKRIVGRIRKAWPEVQILFRGDSHHTKPEVMHWLDEYGADFITGLTKNKKLDELFKVTIESAERKQHRTGSPVRAYGSGWYAAGSWGDRMQRVICRVRVSDKGTDVRYLVTSLEQTGAKYLYETVYCDRGNMELMIKDHKVGLKSDRTSCTRKEANQFRLFLHSAAYVIMHALRDNLLRGSEFARAQFDTIRLRLLKIGARVEVKKTLVRFHLPKSYPLKSDFYRACAVLQALDSS